MPAPGPDSERRLVEVGKLGRAHGLQGFIVVRSYTRPAANIVDYQPWFIGTAEAGEAVTLDDWRVVDEEIRVRFAGTRDRDAAAALSGAAVWVARAQLPPAGPDEYYWFDLLGCRVEDRSGRPLGRVAELMETGEHDVMKIRGEDGERLIPFVFDVYVERVDLDARLIRVDWQD